MTMRNLSTATRLSSTHSWWVPRLRATTTRGSRLRPTTLLIGSGSLILGVLGITQTHHTLRATCEESKAQSESSISPPGDTFLERWLSFDSVKSHFTALSTRLAQISSELSGDPDSLYQAIVEESLKDLESHPELGWRATVRLGSEVGFCEKAYLRQRKQFMKSRFASLIGVEESEVCLRSNR